MQGELGSGVCTLLIEGNADSPTQYENTEGRGQNTSQHGREPSHEDGQQRRRRQAARHGYQRRAVSPESGRYHRHHAQQHKRAQKSPLDNRANLNIESSGTFETRRVNIFSEKQRPWYAGCVPKS